MKRFTIRSIYSYYCISPNHQSINNRLENSWGQLCGDYVRPQQSRDIVVRNSLTTTTPENQLQIEDFCFGLCRNHTRILFGMRFLKPVLWVRCKRTVCTSSSCNNFAFADWRRIQCDKGKKPELSDSNSVNNQYEYFGTAFSLFVFASYVVLRILSVLIGTYHCMVLPSVSHKHMAASALPSARVARLRIHSW